MFYNVAIELRCLVCVRVTGSIYNRSSELLDTLSLNETKAFRVSHSKTTAFSRKTHMKLFEHLLQLAKQKNTKICDIIRKLIHHLCVYRWMDVCM